MFLLCVKQSERRPAVLPLKKMTMNWECDTSPWQKGLGYINTNSAVGTRPLAPLGLPSPKIPLLKRGKSAN